MHKSGLFTEMNVVELCLIASSTSPLEWTEDIISPYKLFGKSIFGNSLIPLNREYSMSLIDAIVGTGLCESNSEARNCIKGGGIMVNRVKVKDTSFKIDKMSALPNLDAVVIEKGKRNYGIIEFCDDFCLLTKTNNSL